MRFRPSHLVPVAFLALVACGGKSDPAAPVAPSTTMSAETALDLAEVFLVVENELNSEEAMPGVMQAGDALSLQGAGTPACVEKTILSPTSVKFHYVNCTGPRGGTVNGDVIISWTTDRHHFSKTFQRFILAREGKSWTLDGTKKVDIDPAAKQSHVTAENFHKVWSDGKNTKDFHYTCNLFADWATPNTYKLYGNWGLEGGGDPALQVSIDKKTPLVWNKGCCHPMSGTKEISRGSEKATLVFGPGCGDVTVNGTPKHLAPCP
ncbi:MAG: hypothetical protein HY823_07470 [Acidobacteria bacterium]|nr:hypothetical protein [Acidobacteriota bacterium]